ncbi:hypothetical protein INT45_007093 [Circinella minor]|uniref:F-box domain-containing protein n=1 Tax=Circinella minor TaxID=1195481 RepID=A0A8H7VSV9_9FUNG|nr:hypothetical protein INT45_007093 [Circinella minor]
MQLDDRFPESLSSNTALSQDFFDEIKKSTNELDYDKTIHLTSVAINAIKLSQLTIAYDHRAYGLMRQCKFDAAIQDIKKMIECHPELGTNYLKLANVLDMQGKQERVYRVCDEALKKSKILEDDPLYGKLVQLRNAADEKRTRRIDPLAVLPIKLDAQIFTLLTTKERVNLMYISPLWRQRISQCEAAWESVKDNPYPLQGSLVARVLPHVAKHIKELQFPTHSIVMLSKYLEHMENGYFAQIEKLKLLVNFARTQNATMLFINAFWKIRYTLTTLHLEIPECKYSIKLAEILFYCRNLKVLTYVVVNGSLPVALGDLELLEDSHDSLIDLSLSTRSVITGQPLKTLVRWCPNLRRLVIGECSSDVFDIVLEDCPKLDIFYFDNNRGVITLPCLSDLNEKYNKNSSSNDTDNTSFLTKTTITTTTTPIIATTSSVQLNDNDTVGQLRILSTPTSYLYHGSGTPISQLMRFLQKNQKTLEQIYANMSMTTEQKENGEPHPLLPNYGVNMLSFDRLEHLTYVADIYGVMEKFFLNSIESSHSSLNSFEAVDSFNIPAVVDTLIKIPPVQKLKFFYHTDQEALRRNTYQYNYGDTEQKQQQDDAAAEQSMVRLFESYASSCNNYHLLPSTIEFNNDNNTRVLETVIFEECKFITDNVLNTFAEIKTLKALKLKNISAAYKITTRGFKDFLIKLGQNTRIMQLELNHMDEVVKEDDGDEMLCLIGKNMIWLKTLHLEDLANITYQGINDMLDVIKGKIFRNLTIEQCEAIAEQEYKIENHIKKYCLHVNLEVDNSYCG